MTNTDFEFSPLPGDQPAAEPEAPKKRGPKKGSKRGPRRVAAQAAPVVQPQPIVHVSESNHVEVSYEIGFIREMMRLSEADRAKVLAALNLVFG